MVCKNCGADLKPGIKYCLNCGNYLEEEDEEIEEKEDFVESVDEEEKDDTDKTDGFNKSFSEIEDKSSSKSEKHKRKLSTMDIIIYSGLILVIVISLIVIIVSIGNSKKADDTPVVTKVSDNEVTVNDYTITFSGELSSSHAGNLVYITDKENYSFSYRNKIDSYKKYSSDLSILSSDLKKNGFDVISTETKNLGENEFIVYKFKSSGVTKYLYVTSLKDKYVTMGIIDTINNGDWEKALIVINNINKNIKFKQSDEDKINEVLDNSLSDVSMIINKS